MPQKMEAEILFLERRDLQPGVTALTELGFEVETLDWIDPCSDETVWIKARIEKELNQYAFFDWMFDLVKGLRGADLVTAATLLPPPSS